MTSLLTDARLGVQRPRLLRLPPLKTSSAGAEAAELAEGAGLFLDPWQRWVLDEALAERDDGQWAAFECLLIVPRQNGKGGVLEALELAALFLHDVQLVVHSAHQFKTAREHFLRMQRLVRASDDLFSKVDHIWTGAGAEEIGLRNGARLTFVARSRGAARGFSGDLIVLDEAYQLPVEAVDAMIPALSAMPNPQVWYTSSAPHVDSHVLHAKRRQGLDGSNDRLFYAEWGNEADVDINDRDAWAEANPALGIRITEEFIENEQSALSPEGFARERLGVPSEEDFSAGVFGPGRWAACGDVGSQVEGTVALALDVAPDMAFSSFAAAGYRADGLAHGELVDRHPGTGWVVARAVELHGRWQVPVAVDPKGPVAGLIPDLADAGVEVFELADGQVPKACARLQEKVLDGTFRHVDQRPLNDAAYGAAIRVVGDSWRWSRVSSRVDISPLMAVTVALSCITEPVDLAANVW